MKKSIIAVMAAIAFVSAPVAYANKDNNDGMGNSNGATAQMRNIDNCVTLNAGTVKTYDIQSHVKPCTMSGDKYSGKQIPEQKFKTPFR